MVVGSDGDSDVDSGATGRGAHRQILRIRRVQRCKKHKIAARPTRPTRLLVSLSVYSSVHLSVSLCLPVCTSVCLFASLSAAILDIFYMAHFVFVSHFIDILKEFPTRIARDSNWFVRLVFIPDKKNNNIIIIIIIIVMPSKLQVL